MESNIVPFSTFERKEKGNKRLKYAVCCPFMSFENVVWKYPLKDFFEFLVQFFWLIVFPV